MSFNSTEFAWKDLTITVMGRTLERIMEISYDVEEDKKQIYGRGKKVRGIQGGNEKPMGSITIGQSEMESLIRKAQETNPNGKLTDLSFDIQIHYRKGTDLVKDRIVGAEFTKNPKDFKQGDAAMDIKLAFICMDILYNVN